MKEAKSKIVNLNTDDFTLNCILCGGDIDLSLTAHRNSLHKVIGFVVACKDCQPELCKYRVSLFAEEATNGHKS